MLARLPDRVNRVPRGTTGESHELPWVNGGRFSPVQAGPLGRPLRTPFSRNSGSRAATATNTFGMGTNRGTIIQGQLRRLGGDATVQAIEQRGQDSRRSKYRALKNFGQRSFEDGRRFGAIELHRRSRKYLSYLQFAIRPARPWERNRKLAGCLGRLSQLDRPPCRVTERSRSMLVTDAGPE
jgi:hypothetical protein